MLFYCCIPNQNEYQEEVRRTGDGYVDNEVPTTRYGKAYCAKLTKWFWKILRNFRSVDAPRIPDYLLVGTLAQIAAYMPWIEWIYERPLEGTLIGKS